MLRQLIISFSIGMVLFCAACDYTYEFSEVKVKNQYAISFPDYMEEEKTGKLSSDASLSYVNFFRNIYAIVLDEPKKVESLEVIAKTAKTDLTKQLTNPSGFGEQTLTVNGLPAYQFSLAGDVGNEGLNERIYYKVTIIEGKEHHYQIVLWTWAKWREKYEETLGEIVGSFKEL